MLALLYLKLGCSKEENKELKYDVRLHTVSNAAIFTAKCGQFIENIDYSCGRYTLDAKSLMGVLSVGLDRECSVEIQTEDKAITDKFRNEIRVWIID